MAMENNHTNYIHQVSLPSGTYDIHDANAVHTLADLAALGMSTEGVFTYKGIKATISALPTTGNKTGDVWHVTEDDSEYVWTGSEWEEFGHHFLVEHVHTVTVTGTNTASKVTGTITVTGGNAKSAVTGSTTVTGTNAASNVTASGEVTVPTVSKTAKYAKVSTGSADFVKSYPGATSKMVTTSVIPAGAATSVVASVTPTTGSIKGVDGSTTASKATAGTAVAVAKAGTAVTVAKRAASQTTVGNANVGSEVTVATGLTGGSVSNGSKGSAASWSASVTDGVLSFSFTANTPTTPTAVTLPTASTTKITPATTSTTKIYGCGDTASITPAVSNGNITPYTFADITVPVAAEDATTVVTGVSTGSADVATVGTAVTVATGALASNGGGSAVMTGLGTASTAKALTSASLAAGASTDVHVGDVVTVGSEEVEVSVSGTAAAQTWTQKTGTISGEAAAQVWTENAVTHDLTAGAQAWKSGTITVSTPV